MCGILGGVSHTKLPDQAVVLAALGSLARRGPDAQGVMHGQQVFLGHRRLSIIDLDPRAGQPMALGPWTIVFNGEIYNYRSLRQELETAGHVFVTQSDTEVILASFARHGKDCLSRLEGMFAFAIWDANSQILTLARDRFGEKPLVIYEDRDRFLFASEVYALEQLVGRKNLEPDLEAISLYFQLSYVPAPYGPYRHMRQIEPGTWLELDLSTFTTHLGRYYQLAPKPRSIGLDEAVLELRERLERSVRQRIFAADVPVATFLSGGIDSSIVSTLAARHSPNGITAYSVAFPDDPGFDESSFAVQVAKECPAMRHRIIPITETNLLDFTEETLGRLGEPFADSSLIPTAYLCAQVQEKVILGGDGADELFAGYGIYDAMRQSLRMPSWLKGLAFSLPRHPNPHAIANRHLRAAALFLGHLRNTPEAEYLAWRCYMSPEEVVRLGLPTTSPECMLGKGVGQGILAGILTQDILVNLPGDMLKKVDLASMQHGLEVRLPYLDSGLVDFALSLPEALLIKGRCRKYVLKQAYQDLLPRSVVVRGKQGFLLPVRRWFCAGRLRDRLADLARSSTLLDGAVISRLLSEHQRGKADHSVPLWACLAYLVWSSRR